MAEEFNNQLYVRADVVQLHIKEAVNAEREACFKETYDVAMKAAEAGIDKAMELEREKVAQWMMQRSYATGHGDTTEDLLAELAWQIQEQWERIEIAEREACAKVCENGTFLHDFSREAVYSRACARAIRAKGQA